MTGDDFRREIERDLNHRASAVAEWLRGKLLDSSVWLWSELDIQARVAGYDLDEWFDQPAVQAVAEVHRVRLGLRRFDVVVARPVPAEAVTVMNDDRATPFIEHGITPPDDDD